MIKEAISELISGKDLSPEMATKVMEEVMTGSATQAQIASFLTALHMKGETIEEITACAKVLRQLGTKVEHSTEAIEIVGTGGDRAHSFNISTAAAFVTAAAGVPVAKHGNRAASSSCGTADCLEALGVNLSVSPEVSAKLLEELGICFLFAQKYHSAMRFVGGVRAEIGIPTIFNCLGPLANPAQASLQLLGVYKEDLVQPLAHVLANLGVRRGMVVFGRDVLDEISLTAPTAVCEFSGDQFTSYVIEPEMFGFEKCAREELVGGSPQENAEIIRSIFRGEQGAKRNVVLLNAGAALHIAKEIPMEEGVKLAEKVIDSGLAMEKLEAFTKATNA